MSGDGNCMFRAISLALYGSESDHASLRAIAVETLKETPRLHPFIDGDDKDRVEKHLR